MKLHADEQIMRVPLPLATEIIQYLRLAAGEGNTRREYEIAEIMMRLPCEGNTAPAIPCTCGNPLTYGVVHTVSEMCWVPYAESGETRPYRGIESMNRPDLRVPVANDKETSDDRPWSPEQVRQAVWRLIDQTAGKP